MRLEEWLAVLARRFRVETALIAAGVRDPERQRLLTELREAIALELAHRQLLEQELLAEAERLFLGSLLALDLDIPAAALARASAPRHIGRLNRNEAVALWLGWKRPRTFGLAGLWQIYLDLDDPSLPLPDVIMQIFSPHGRDEENQAYIGRLLRESRKYGLDLDDADTSKIIAWLVETHPDLRGRPCSEVAEELRHRGSKAVGSVDQGLLRGGNTLMDEFVRRVYRAIDTA